MNIVNLKTFLSVVQAGNLNRAAEQLHVTQSTVTARLDALDEQLGQALLVRSRKGAQLTKAGFAFQRHAELILRTWEQGCKAVGLPKGFSGMVAFGCHGELWPQMGERWTRAVQASHPEIAFEVWPGNTADISRWLETGLVDVALSLSPEVRGDVTSLEVKQDRLVQVSSEPRAARDWDEGYIYVDHGADFRREHSLAWPSKNTARMSFGSSEWALQHLLREGGSAYLPWRMTQDHCAQGKLFQVEGAPEFCRPVYFNWRQLSAQMYPWLASSQEGVF